MTVDRRRSLSGETAPSPAGAAPGTAQLPGMAFAAESASARFTRVARACGPSPAIVTAQHTLTYAELDRLSNRMAHAVLAACPPGQQRVALLLDHGPMAIAAMLGVLKAGKIYVPLDPAYPVPRIAQMIGDADAALLLTTGGYRDFAEELTGYSLSTLELDRLPAALPEAECAIDVPADAIAYILYTSGSTGRPKGVVQTHRNLLHFIASYSQGLRITASDRLSLLYSFSFSASLMDIYGALLNGATLLPYDLKALGLAGLPHWLREQRITVYHSVPTVFRHLLDTPEATSGFPLIRAIDLGGEPVYRRDVEAFRRHFAPGCLFINHLAFTEASVTAQYPIDHTTPLPSTDRVPVGPPAPGITALILDERGAELGPNEVGEIAVQSRYLSPGYWGQPELTATVFGAAANGQERIYRTGDLGRKLDNGYLEHLGRKDSRVKIRGYSIEVAEVEQALLRQGDLKEVAVIAREDIVGDPRLVAYIVPADGIAAAPRSTTLRARLAAALPDYMLPTAFVTLPALPVNPNGKVDRRALPAPHSCAAERGPDLKLAETLTERRLAPLWAQALQINEVGIDESFFTLGGHSLLALRLLQWIEQEFGTRLTLATLLRAPTIRELAALLSRQDRAPAWSCLVPLKPEGRRSPLFLAPASGGSAFFYRVLAEHMEPEQPLYTMEPRGMDGNSAPIDRIEGMAADYIAALRSVQPAGPYFLGGLSFGGVIAAEMARQLVADGHRVAVTVMFDSWAPGYPHYISRRRVRPDNLSPHDPTTVWDALRNRAGFHLENLKACVGLAARYRYLRARTRRVRPQTASFVVAQRARLAENEIVAIKGIEKMEANLPLPTGLRAVIAAEERARASYRAGRYPGRIVLLRARFQRPWLTREPLMGWQGLTEQPIEVIETAGTHYSLLEEPCVAITAAHLHRILAEARAG